MRRGLLLEHADFRRLWIGETLSQFGSQVSALAIPLVAVVTLHASTFQTGALVAVQSVAVLLIGLPAGAWIDRMRRRPVLVAADLLRVALLASIPAAAAVDLLSLGQVYLVVCVTGVCTVFFDVAYLAYLPTLIGRERLMAGNGRLEASRSTAHLAGPGLAGLLVQAFTAPVALLADALSFGWSAVWLARIRAREPRPEPAPRRLGHDIATGFRLVVGHPTLRSLAGYGATTVAFLSMEHALDVAFLVRAVGLRPGDIGVLYAVTGSGAVLGAFAATPLARRLGQRRTLLATAVVSGAAMLLIPLTAAGPRLACYAVGSGLASCCIVVFNIVSVALRQTLCPDHLLGRMNATMRFLAWGTIPVGGLLGGGLGTLLGLRPTLWISAVGCLAATVWLVGPGHVRGRARARSKRGQRAAGTVASSSDSRAASRGA